MFRYLSLLSFKGNFALASGWHQHALNMHRLPGFIGPAPSPARDKSIRSIKYPTEYCVTCQQILSYLEQFKI